MFAGVRKKNHTVSDLKDAFRSRRVDFVGGGNDRAERFLGIGQIAMLCEDECQWRRGWLYIPVYPAKLVVMGWMGGCWGDRGGKV